MLDDDALMRLFLERLKKVLSEPGEPLDKLAMGLGLQEQVSKIWERDGFLSGYIGAYLLYILKEPLYNAVAGEIEKVKDDYVKKFGSPIGFARGFLSFQKTTGKGNAEAIPK